MDRLSPLRPPIYLVSDSVGETVELVTKAALSQFNGSDINLYRIPYVEDLRNNRGGHLPR